MPTKTLRPIAVLTAAVALLLLAACSPLPAYDTTVTLTLEPAFGDPVTLDANDLTVGAFGDLAAAGQQTAFLWLSVSNGKSGSEEITFFYLRQESDSPPWVEELRVAYEGAIYTSGQVEAGGDANVPDQFQITAYTPEDGQSGIGNITGSLDATSAPLSDGEGNQIIVSLTGLDALVYASEDAASEPDPVAAP